MAQSGQEQTQKKPYGPKVKITLKKIKILVVPKHFIAGRDVVPSLFQSSMENIQPRGVVGLAFEVGQQQAIHPRDVEEKVHLPFISRIIGSF